MSLIEGGDVADDGSASGAAVPFDAQLPLVDELRDEGEAVPCLPSNGHQ